MTSVENYLAKNTFYCSPLHARITPKQCERNRKAPDGSLVGDHIRPVQCKKCDWQAMQAQKPKQQKVKNMPTKEPQLCQGCGKIKTLLSKTLCHSCHQKQKKEEKRNKLEAAAKSKVLEAATPIEPQPEIQVVTQACEHDLTISFALDPKLFQALHDLAHKHYRTPEGEALALLHGCLHENGYDCKRAELAGE